MLFLVFIAAFVIAGLLSGGRFRYAGQHSIRCLWAPILAYALRFALPLILPRIGVSGSAAELATCVAQFALLFVFAALNFRGTLWSPVFGLGALLNFIVIFANGGVMPVTQTALGVLSDEGAAQLASGEIFAYALQDADTKFMLLGDVIYLRAGALSIGYASIGDILLALGAGMFCWSIMRKKGRREA